MSADIASSDLPLRFSSNSGGRCLAGFLRTLTQRNASPHTIKAYRTDLAEFVTSSVLKNSRRLTTF